MLKLDHHRGEAWGGATSVLHNEDEGTKDIIVQWAGLLLLHVTDTSFSQPVEAILENSKT